MSVATGDQSNKSPFPHPWWYPFSSCAPAAKTIDEWTIIDIVNLIKDKPDWETKFDDETIVNKWINEIKQQFKPTTISIDCFIDLIIKDLQWNINTQIQINPFKISIDDRIIYSDNLIPVTLKNQFISQVDEFKSSFEELDYHPGSNNQVIDLIHPSLYPLQYGVTPIISGNQIEICQYDLDKIKVKEVGEFGISKKFQWLPSIFQYNSTLKLFGIVSYINNLHPIKYEPLYQSIESIFNQILPGLNYVLSRYASKEFVRIYWEDWSVYTDEYHDEMSKLWDEIPSQKIHEALVEFNKTKVKYLKPPKINRDGPKIDVSIDLKKFDKIKVITKLADIQLTPENPIYNGGSWHVEGTINEDIVATVIYYYDTENTTESSLSFRTGFDDPPYEQGDEEFCDKVYGIKDEQKMTRDIGTLKTIKDRVIIFPNVCQHHVDSFRLKDKNKPGYRRILAFFIVDPYNKTVVATDDVPIQQKDWWSDGTNILPEEVVDRIKNLNHNLPQSLDEAKQVRIELMEERTAIIDPEDLFDNPYQREFSLCEH